MPASTAALLALCALGGAREIVGSLLDALGASGLSALAGCASMLITQALRATVMARAWRRWGWLAHVLAVAVVSAGVAGVTGWAAGMAALPLLVHVMSTFFASLGWRQVVKRLFDPHVELGARLYSGRRSDGSSIYTRPPQPHRE